jgi:hypothetical protein
LHPPPPPPPPQRYVDNSYTFLLSFFSLCRADMWSPILAREMQMQGQGRTQHMRQHKSTVLWNSSLFDAPLRALKTVKQCRRGVMIVCYQSHFLYGRKFYAQAWVGADSVTIFTPEIAGGTLQTRLSEQISDCQVTQLGLRRKWLFSHFRENLYVENMGNNEKNHNLCENLGENFCKNNMCLLFSKFLRKRANLWVTCEIRDHLKIFLRHGFWQIFANKFPKNICFYENFQNLIAKICVRHEKMKDAVLNKLPFLKQKQSGIFAG